MNADLEYDVARRKKEKGDRAIKKVCQHKIIIFISNNNHKNIKEANRLKSLQWQCGNVYLCR